MRLLILASGIVAAGAIAGSSNWDVQQSGVEARLRGISVVSDTVAWASGTRGSAHGTMTTPAAGKKIGWRAASHGDGSCSGNASRAIELS